MTVKTGSVPTISPGATTTVSTDLATYRDFLKAESEAWTSFTPTWTGSGSNPAIGNGTIGAAYMQSGKKVLFRIRITMGTTTTYGSGGWLLTTPVQPGSGYPVNTHVAMGSAYDSSAVINIPVACARFNAGDSRLYITNPAGALVTSTVPFTWATGDILSINGSYEAA